MEYIHIEIYNGDGGKKEINIQEASKKYDIELAFDDMEHIAREYIKNGIKCIYVKHDYNKEVADLEMIKFE